MRILFVCLGNICRSPTAEGVTRHLLAERGPGRARSQVDSAGTGGWHVGAPPDERSAAAAAARRGIVLEGAARQVRASDFADYDLLVAMDRSNLRDLLRRRARRRRARQGCACCSATPTCPIRTTAGPSGFDDVLDLVTEACERLVDEVAGGLAR